MSVDPRDAMVAPAEQEPRRKLDPDAHVVLLDGGGFKCERCCRIYVMALPAPLSVYIAASHAFVGLHVDCPKPKTPAAAVAKAEPKRKPAKAKTKTKRRPRR